MDQRKIRVAHDDAQHVVEVVGNTACQAAHGIHLLGLQQLCLEMFPLGFGLEAGGDVADENQMGIAAVEAEGDGFGFDRDPGAVEF